jgi:hypothetical protein
MVLVALVLVSALVPALDPRSAHSAQAVSFALDGAAAASVAWLVAALVYASLEPRRDAAAAQRLALLRDGASTPGCALLQIVSITWSGAAGQRAICVDVATGAALDLWFAERQHAPGAFVLARLDGYRALSLDAVPLGLVDAAHRHAARQPAVDGSAVVAAVEHLTRKS